MGAGQNIEYITSRKRASDAADIRGLLPTVTHEVMKHGGRVRTMCLSCGGSKSRGAFRCLECFRRGRARRAEPRVSGIDSLPMGRLSAPPLGRADLRVGRRGHSGTSPSPPVWKRHRLVDGVWVDA